MPFSYVDFMGHNSAVRGRSELPFQWSPDGSRDWEETVREIYRKGLATVASHVADHQARGESLVGREKEFTLRCHC